jgi:hypothetical protein
LEFSCDFDLETNNTFSENCGNIVFNVNGSFLEFLEFVNFENGSDTIKVTDISSISKFLTLRENSKT